MEKYARQALSEGIKNPEDIHVNMDSELYRVINLHYNRNNHIEVSFKAEYFSNVLCSSIDLSIAIFREMGCSRKIVAVVKGDGSSFSDL